VAAGEVHPLVVTDGEPAADPRVLVGCTELLHAEVDLDRVLRVSGARRELDPARDLVGALGDEGSDGRLRAVPSAVAAGDEHRVRALVALVRDREANGATRG